MYSLELLIVLRILQVRIHVSKIGLSRDRRVVDQGTFGINATILDRQ